MIFIRPACLYVHWFGINSYLVLEISDLHVFYFVCIIGHISTGSVSIVSSNYLFMSVNRCQTLQNMAAFMVLVT